MGPVGCHTYGRNGTNSRPWDPVQWDDVPRDEGTSPRRWYIVRQEVSIREEQDDTLSVVGLGRGHPIGSYSHTNINRPCSDFTTVPVGGMERNSCF